jgi:nucleotide-binding universal stress UspA family protein
MRKDHAMVEIQRILCPIDYSEFSRRALDHAISIARWYGSTITVLHVNHVLPVTAFTPVGPVIPPTLLTPDDRSAMLAAIQKFAAEEAAPGVPLEFEIAEGKPTAEILAKAKDLRCDLLVLGTHGYSGFDRLVLGSVAEKVLRKAECPVLTVPCHGPDAVPIPAALFKHILCAVDFSASSIRALTYAVSLAEEADAHLTLLHVIELPPGTPEHIEQEIDLPEQLREVLATTENDRRERLQDIIPVNAKAFCTIDTTIATGKPHREILRVAAGSTVARPAPADHQPAGLIVMGVHGRSATDLLLFGSTTHHVVRQARCPVLTLRA